MTRHSIAFGATVCVGLATLAADLVAIDGLRAVVGAGSAGEAEVISEVPSGAAAAPSRPEPEPQRSGEEARPEGLQVLVTHASEPLGGAEVRAYLRHHAEVVRGEPQWTLAGVAATGADGVASIAAPAGTYLVTARSPLLAPAHAAVVRPAGEARTAVTFALVARVGVAGRVLARRDGEPVPLASLALCRTGLDLLGAVPMPAEECARAIADPSGRFSLSVAPGRYALEAAATGFHRARLAVTAPAALDVRLAAGAVVEGFVLQPDGAPAGAAEVLLAGGDEVVSATAGTSGGFAAEVAAGTYTVTARRGSAAGAWPVLVTVAAGGRARGLVIRLGAAAAIGGVVTAADGAPLPGAAVAVSSPGATGELAHAESDARGRFAVEALAAGTYQVAVAADGWTPASRTGIAVLAGERVELAIALARQGAIEGVVRDGAGRVVEGARVSAGRRTWEAPGAAEAVARTDAAGRFLLRALEAGRNEVAAARDDAGTGVIASVDVAPGSVTPVDLTLPETGRLEGVVLGRDRAPPGRAVVLVRSRAPPPVSARVEVDRDGAYALQLPAGDYDAVAAPAEGAGAVIRPRPATVRVAPGQASRLDLILDAKARAAMSPAVVQVLEPDGSGSPGTLVLVTAGDDLRNAGSAVTDEAGVARVDLAERGSLLVRALRSGRAGGPVPLDTPGPTVVTLRPPARLRGRVVTADGPPVAGFSFQLAALGDDASVASNLGGPAATMNARAVQAPLLLEFGGDRFEVADAPAGPVRVSVQTPSGRFRHVELELAPGELRELEVVLEPGSSVEGRAIDARSRAPLPGAAVVVLGALGSPGRPEVTTGADGRFRLTGLPMGARRVRLIAPGYGPTERDAELGAGDSVDLGEIALPVGTQASILPRSP